ncbi:nucleotidyltransferase family protein [Salinisphaera sp. SPP-AMP-43]|uniref:nucleotidyltransferase family protein n=1 Tax=Salinisphaera sp. SPP-AMP-43 TaxID=3121288 RepID=UPI003C6DCBE2
MTTVVLAAGRSRRFGPANKLLAEVDGVPLIVRTLRRVMAATDGPVCLVIGHQAHRLRQALARHGLRSARLHIVHSRFARAGMSHSLARGLFAAPRISTAIQVHLGDMPGIDRRTTSGLRRRLNHGYRVARPHHRGQPGHPVRLRRAILPSESEVAQHGLRATLRHIAAAERDRFEAGPHCVADYDRRQMLRVLIQPRTHRHTPSPVRCT